MIILLINTDKQKAVEVAEDLRQEIQNHSHTIDGFQVTSSFGIATFGQDASSFDGLISKSDKALYSAKAQGRNKVYSA